MKKKYSVKRILLLLGFLIACVRLGGESLAAWDFQDIDLDALSSEDHYELPAQITADGFEASVRLGDGLNPTVISGQYGFKIPQNNAQTTLAGAIAENHYIEFTLRTTEDHLFSLESLFFYGQSGNTGADAVAVLYDNEGFSTEAVLSSLTGIAGETGGFDTDASGFGAAIALNEGFSNLNNATFRIYGWNTTHSNGTTYLRNLSGDDLVIKGSIIPEYRFWALLSSAVAFIAVALRNRWRN